jgi:hypothetical protein
MTFGESGLIRGMTFGESGLIRGMTFGETVFGCSRGGGLIKGELLYLAVAWEQLNKLATWNLIEIPN